MIRDSYLRKETSTVDHPPPINKFKNILHANQNLQKKSEQRAYKAQPTEYVRHW